MATRAPRVLSKPLTCTSTYLRHPQRSFASTPQRAVDFTHTVVGAGVVGLATARALQLHSPDNAVLLLERHPGPGAETSSRNSEVVHAGLYYGHSSLKTALCLRGKNALYAYAAARHIPIAQTGKWLVAQTDAQRAALDGVASFAAAVGDGANDGLDSSANPPGFRGPASTSTHAIPLRALTSEQCAAAEPDVRAAAGALESSSTGIVDSHALMTALLGDFEEAGGTAAFASDVRHAQYNAAAREWELRVAPSNSNGTSDPAAEESAVSSATLINSAGLGAIALSNAILPASEHREPAFAKGTYFGYSASRPRPRRLIYPAPVPGHGGLGTHLTLDLGGRVRFGPDVEWVSDAADVTPRADPERVAAALDDITSYLPGLDRDAVTVDYCGIRPKLRQGASATAGSGFEDFYITIEEGVPHGAFVNMLGIESPGLTSSLAIGDYVRDLLYK